METAVMSVVEAAPTVQVATTVTMAVVVKTNFTFYQMLVIKSSQS